MTEVDEAHETRIEARHLDSVDEAGTAPEDRKFRPDVEGLRAVAIALVVLYHAGLTQLGGGYVGVDVFFVISGFVITGVLLREHTSSQRVSIVGFYGRRSRRIIPAATLVIVATVIAAYGVLGLIDGNQAAIDARWTAVFLANFHFAAEGTNYLSAQQPPSPLQNFWSLAVEEQFYLVYPAVFIVIASIRTKLSIRVRLTIGLATVIAVSFAWSVIQTGSSPLLAFFSPFTRAWELALGALVAVATHWLLEIPRRIGSIMTWTGLAAIAFAAVDFTAATPYPGSLDAFPVVGAALVIGGGVTAPRWGAESLLKLPPFRWLGKMSYSLYLWHWPILIIAAEEAGRSSLPLRNNLGWLVVALLASVVTYRLIENPVRHATFPIARHWAPIVLGVVLIATSVGVATIQLDAHTGPISAASPAPGKARTGANPNAVKGFLDPSIAVADAVRKAPTIRTIPADLTPSLGALRNDWGGPPPLCEPSLGQTTIPACTFANKNATRTMVLYGDSHAAMWFDALVGLAAFTRWRLVYLGKSNCPADQLPYQNPPGWGRAGGEYSACDQWHRFAIERINRIHPDLVIITQEYRATPGGTGYSPKQWQKGLESTIKQLAVPTSKIVVLGNIPILKSSPAQCLVNHPSNIQACSSPNEPYLAGINRAEQRAAKGSGARYVSVLPWFCSTTCTAIVGKYQVYWNRYHVTAAYSVFLGGVLAKDLDLATAP